MPDTNLTLWSAISGGVGGLVIAVLSALGLKGRIDNIDKTKVEKDAFKEYQKAQTTEHSGFGRELGEIKTDVKHILLHMPKRNGDK